MDEHDRSRQPQRPDLSSDEALDRLLWRLGPLMRWQEHEETGAPEEGVPQLDPAFARRLRAHLTAREEAEETAAPAEGHPPPARRGRRLAQGGVALRVGLAAAALALVILVAVAVVEVGVVAALTTALALAAVAVVLVVRARLGQ